MPAKPQLSLAGRTLRWSFSEEPTAKKTYEHTFNPDGTVVYREVGGITDAKPDASGKDNAGKKEDAARKPTPKTQYASFEVAPGVHFVSYLAAESGYTLTVLADTNTGIVYAIASSAKEWYPLTGTLEPTS